MNNNETDIVIIGGGLCGLCLAYLFRNSQLNVTILEARNRLGGRIYTLDETHVHPIEMGATWLGEKHLALNGLLKELDLSIFPQKLGEKAIYEPISTSPAQLVSLPPNDNPSYRIQGGSSALIKRLAVHLPRERLVFNQKVNRINLESSHIDVFTAEMKIRTNVVVSTLPPNLFLRRIAVTPDLPISLQEIMSATHTWMGESIKVGLSFDIPFWESDQSSSTLFSNVGPIPELYDHTNYEGTKISLKGFLNGAYAAATLDQRKEAVLKQLHKYYGDSILTHKSYSEYVWREDPFTYADYSKSILPHENNGHAIYQKPLLSNRLYLAGSETAVQFPGYMEGAVNSAYFVYDKLMKQF